MSGDEIERGVSHTATDGETEEDCEAPSSSAAGAEQQSESLLRRRERALLRSAVNVLPRGRFTLEKVADPYEESISFDSFMMGSVYINTTMNTVRGRKLHFKRRRKNYNGDK